MRRFTFFAFALIHYSFAFSGEADVLKVVAECDSDSICDFIVTVRHADDGWEHYADRWEVRTVDGKRMAVRELAHPHDNEQPFTRSLENVRVPPDLVEVIVRARDSRHGYGGEEITVKLRHDTSL